MLLVVIGNRGYELEGNQFISLLAVYLNFDHLGLIALAVPFFLLLLGIG